MRNKKNDRTKVDHLFSDSRGGMMVLLALLFVISSCTNSANNSAGQNRSWIGTWSSSQQLVEPRNMPPEPGLENNTLRQVVHVSLGGDSLRVTFSNTYGNAPLTLNEVHLAVSDDSSAIRPETDQTLYFDGKKQVTINPDTTATTDPFAFDLQPQSNVTITIHYGQVPSDLTGHPGSRTTSYVVEGNQLSATAFDSSGQKNRWYTIRSIEVLAPDSAASVIALGNSITDGRSSGINKQARWTDYLARRLQANPETSHISVLNQGIGGNCVLKDCLGPSALSRFQEDVLNQPKAKWLIIMEGVNDIGGSQGAEGAAQVAENLIDAYKTMIDKAHDHDMKIYGATITPFGGSFYDSPPKREVWKKVNEWIRTSGHFDAVIDFAAALRDPEQPTRLLPKADSGDHLHPSPQGYQMMAKAIDLKLFKKDS
ncbi:SGNH/GDSL hydrolase family protein [Aliifodinibius salicampi]|uniref:SGNH/GDSL hydrolase family protein n=1 Tax=Fodinibius salicampi TaxID=1920655 RepID=A0ABT3PUH7_9BACT|nr:SGNH/GDSL hydrolase family protein [Fodinibius salicampi]MCW9711497.1 SGNH/GDSL hydrolase family protein [Fodinibius salicampi]